MSHIHLIGIGGAGLSAIATVLLQQGYIISGSDAQSSANTERLAQLGATIFIGHRAENVGSQVESVVISSAIPPHNPELLAARQLGLAVFKRDVWLGKMMSGYTGIAIAGTHGKTTTTAMVAYLLQQAGQEPTYIIGGFVPQLGSSAAAGQGKSFVIEADEYDHTFLGLRPEVAVVTIVEWDHPDIFPTFAECHQAFVDFVQLVPPTGLVVGCGDAPGVSEVIKQAKAKVVTYGLQAHNDWQAVEVQPNQRGGYDFRVQRSGVVFANVSLAIPGLHNVTNALAALVVADIQGIELTQAAEIISRFEGVERRFELKGEFNGMTIIDDYAHHPTEIKATLAAARARFPNRPIWVLFQPHTFSRTRALLNDFATAFDQADHVIITDIFGSRETDTGLVHSRDIVRLMSHPDVLYLDTLHKASVFLATRLRPGDVLLTLGAGDGYKVGEWVLDHLPTVRVLE